MTSAVQMHNQFEFLQEHYRLTKSKPSDASGLSSEDLLHTSEVIKFIDDELIPLLNAPSRLVAASQFSKKYAFLITVPFFSSFTLFDQVLNIDIDQCSVQPDSKKGFKGPRLMLKSERTSPTATDREGAVHNAIEKVFKNHVRLVWERLNEAASVPMPVLWENTAIYIYWLYETSLLKHDLVAQRKIQEDFDLLLEAPGECFGLNENPLKKFHHEKRELLKSAPLVRVRKTCCLYYEVNEERKFCKTCPRCLSGYTES
ncbi:IucA/IucC family C-terminal-domain containing protein [Pseudalkalibacillus berkeleyi]|uniref:(2Fe-2S)-binding protein n=1 Tax=Pseudalkalibacillus berkeleyi TaxID=1069813 RepID=A0ABS9GTT7_9BACL|nr:IucA/IucC family C-terminal-domain containing protein [Pseudalkalibacillus berkeleyi]MCF6136258.1 (2Fe-2S)-binding protein [Pseudalkalibacillus berkeleyi]